MLSKMQKYSMAALLVQQAAAITTTTTTLASTMQCTECVLNDHKYCFDDGALFAARA